MKKNTTKSGPFGLALLYVMVHVPGVHRCKVGITGRSVKKRAKGIDEEMPGFPLPIFAVPLFGAYTIEQALHSLLGGLQTRFYKGSGHTEWFLFPAHIIAPVLAAAAFVIQLFTLYTLIAYLCRSNF